jgi:hypothetical protein
MCSRMRVYFLVYILYRDGGTCSGYNRLSHLIFHTLYSPTTVGVTITHDKVPITSSQYKLLVQLTAVTKLGLI